MVMDTDEALTDEVVDADASAADDGQPAADPQAALLERLNGLEAEVGRLKGLDPSKIGPALGRVSALQSELAAMKGRNPADDLDPRISANENLTVALAQALADSDLVDDRFKQTLNTALNGIDQARGERERNRLERALDAKVEEKLASLQPKADADETPWAEATEPVLELAQELGVDPAAIPWQAIRVAAGTPAKATALATKWLYENQTDPATKRVAERKQAAGSGSPKPGSASNADDIANRLMTDGLPITADKERRAIAERLGITL